MFDHVGSGIGCLSCMPLTLVENEIHEGREIIDRTSCSIRRLCKYPTQNAFNQRA